MDTFLVGLEEIIVNDVSSPKRTTRPCYLCHDLDGAHNDLSLTAVVALAKECPTCAILLAAVQAITGGDVPTGSIILKSKDSNSGGPLRLDVLVSSSRLRLQLYTVLGDPPSPWSVIGEAEHIPEDGLADSSIRLAAQWIESCSRGSGKHVKCLRPDIPVLPNRVIYVGSSDAQLRIHLTGESEKGRYAALSHCWGGKAPLQTTVETIHQFANQLPTPLPQTFADAVLVTRRLDIPYLWIDSLCIIQDCKDDWKTEAARMASVYQDALVTISADAASDSTAGFLVRTVQSAKALQYSLTTPDNRTKSGRLYVRAKGDLAQELPYHSIRREDDINPEDLTSGIHRHRGNQKFDTTTIQSRIMRGGFTPGDEVLSPLRSKLSARAWVFQERILSPRTLHFSADEMAWECRSVCECECSAAGPRSQRKISILKSLLLTDTKAAMAQAWRDQIIPSYTELDLTVPTDRLPALAGLAAAAGRIRSLGGGTKDTYIAGLWQQTLALDLLWYSADINQPSTTKISIHDYTARVPTWSWASITGPISYLRGIELAVMRFRILRIENLNLSSRDASPQQYGIPASRPSLLVYGLLVESTIIPSFWDEFGRGESKTSQIGCAATHKPRRGRIPSLVSATWDVPRTREQEEEEGMYGGYWFLLMGVDAGPTGLLLRKLEKGSLRGESNKVETKKSGLFSFDLIPTFERVGLVHDMAHYRTQRRWSGAGSDWAHRRPMPVERRLKAMEEFERYAKTCNKKLIRLV